MARKAFDIPDGTQTTPEEKPKSQVRKRVPLTGLGATDPARLRSATEGVSKERITDIKLSDIKPESTIKDRIEVSEGLDSLVESLRNHGQRIPILVRYLDDGPFKYEIVTGRRRLAAARKLQKTDPENWSTIKGTIERLDDKQAFIAQGLENSERLETSFIERARAAAQAKELGFQQKEISDFLGVSKGLVSQMVSIYEAVGEEFVLAIGPARGVGRRKWEALIAEIKKSEPSIADFHDVIAIAESNLSVRMDGSVIDASSDEFTADSAGAIERFDAILVVLSGYWKKLKRRSDDRDPVEQPRMARGKLFGGKIVFTKKSGAIQFKATSDDSAGLIEEIESVVKAHLSAKEER